MSVTAVTNRYRSHSVTGQATVTTVTTPYKGVTAVTLTEPLGGSQHD